MAKSYRKKSLDPSAQAKISDKAGLQRSELDSSPSFGTVQTSFSQELEVFLEAYQTLWHSPVAERYPYKLARLIHHDYDLSKRWYVVFYAWDITEERLRRRRLFEPINRRKTVQERLSVSTYVINMVNADLLAGKTLGHEENVTHEINVNISKMKLVEALEFVANEKKATEHRESYYRGFNILATNWKEWLEYEQRDDFLVRLIKRTDLIAFFRFLKVKNLSNKTYNNYRNNLSTALNFLSKLEPKLFKVNPASVIETLPVISRKHAAFNDKQVKLIKAECQVKGYHQLLLFIQFIYYTLSRPNEIIQFRLHHIDLERDRIFIPGDVSKTRFDEYVGISAHFKKVIQESGIMDYPGNYFVFGSSGKPGEKRYASADPMWRRNNQVLKSTGLYELNDNFSLYSYKHSGAISLYEATKDIKLVQLQCRHKTLNQTSEYLRDLGLISGHERLKDWEGAA